MNLEKLILDISKDVENRRPLDSPTLLRSEGNPATAISLAIEQVAGNLPDLQKKRLEKEFSTEGPLQGLLEDHDVIEIMLMDRDCIWYEKLGQFHRLEDGFLSDLTFNNFLHRLCDEAKIQTNVQFPFGNGFWRNFRVHICSRPIATNTVITLRRLKSKALTLEDLHQQGWCEAHQLTVLREMMASQQNILVLGNTGSGKTTLLNALLAETAADRSVIIEDTSEILAANHLSVKMLTRFDSQGILPEVDQSQLVKQSLRMRPDRLIIGEIRGGEAKDLLMALSTGHRGSMASLHAHSPSEALLRLEMLVQMGAPQWNLEAIRRLIHLGIDRLVVTRKEKGRWFLEGVYKIASQEKFGFIVEKI